MIVLPIVFGALVFGVVLGGVLARVASPRVAMGSGLVLMVLAGVLLLLAAQASGDEGLGYAIVAQFVLLPAGVAAVLVGLVAHLGLRR